MSYLNSVSTAAQSALIGYATPSNTTTSLTIPVDYLFASNTLTIQLTVWSPFNVLRYSNTLTYNLTATTANSGKTYPCSPCQFNIRTDCAKYNGICWDDYAKPSANYPSLHTLDCHTAIFPACYSIWKNSGTSDSQCSDYFSYVNYTAMGIKPKVTNATYVISDSLKMVVLFDVPIWTQTLVGCSNIMSVDTMKWIGNSGTTLNRADFL